MIKHLFLFQIGPVQSFIASARRTQDLYVGSRLLSILATAGVEAVYRDVEMLFPVKSNDKLPESVTHRFAFISNADPQEVAGYVKLQIESKWESIANTVKKWLITTGGQDKNGAWVKVFDEQVRSWLEFYWVAVDYDENAHGTSYEKAVKALATRKQARTFAHISEPGKKCTLTGAQSALPLDWKQLKQAINDNNDIILRPYEELGAIATIKRFAGKKFANVPDIDDTSFHDTITIAGGEREEDDEGYYFAILHMDGDKMGKHLSGLESLQEHRDFSHKLAYFAQETVPDLIKKHATRPPKGRSGIGKLIYAGGDDVLALLPLWATLPCAEAIRTAFENELGCQMSAGIALTPHKLPLDGALEESRIAEKRAKDHYGRNAICVRQNTGQIREMGEKWEIISLIQDLQLYFEEDQISGKLGYDLLDLFLNLGSSELLKDAMLAEAQRLLKRRLNSNLSKEEKEEILKDIGVKFKKISAAIGWESLAHWVILARFLTKKTEEKAYA